MWAKSCSPNFKMLTCGSWLVTNQPPCYLSRRAETAGKTAHLPAGRQTADSEGVLASCVSHCLIMHHYAWEPITLPAAGVNIMLGPLQECQHKLHDARFCLSFTSHALWVSYAPKIPIMIQLICPFSIKSFTIYFPFNNHHMRFLLQGCLKNEYKMCGARLAAFSWILSKSDYTKLDWFVKTFECFAYTWSTSLAAPGCTPSWLRTSETPMDCVGDFYDYTVHTRASWMCSLLGLLTQRSVWGG